MDKNRLSAVENVEKMNVIALVVFRDEIDGFRQRAHLSVNFDAEE